MAMEEVPVHVDSLLDKVLYVEPLPKNFNPDGVPTTGMEYLQKVHHEAKNCPQTVVAEIKQAPDYTQTPYFVDAGKADTSSKEMLPTLEWQNEQVADFSSVRNIIARRRADNSGCNTSCNTSIPKQCSEKTWLDMFVKDKPYLSVLIPLDQNQILELLDYHVKWLETETTTFKQSALWIYSLFACLKIPLSPEICSTVRDLARLAADARSKLESPNDELLKPLNLIICLVGRYFRQFDLAD